MPKAFKARYDGNACVLCGKSIRKGSYIGVTRKRGETVGKHYYVGTGHRWAHARCIWPKGESDDNAN